MLFLRTELRALTNLLATPSGRKELLGLVITLGCMAFGMMIITNRMLGHEKLLEVIRDDESGTLLRFFLGLGFLPVLMLSLSLVMSVGRTGLFERAEARLVLASPAKRGGTIHLVFWRSMVQCALMSFVLVLVPVFHLLRETGQGAAPYLVTPFVALLLLAPVIALVLAVHVALMRWLASPRLKLAVQTVSGLLGVAGAALAMTGFIIDDDDALEMAQSLAENPTLPFLLDVPAGAVTAAAGYTVSPTLFAWLAVFLVGPFALLSFMGRFFSRAHENSIVVARPVFRARRLPAGSGAPWPRHVALSVARRDAAEILRDPGGAFVYLFLAVFAVGATILEFGASSTGKVPETVATTISLFTQWSLLSMIVAMMLTPAVSMGEKAQQPLLAASPARRSHLLLGRSFGLALVFAWVLLVKTISSVAVGHDAGIVLGAIAVTVPSTLFTLSLVFAFGTLTAGWFGDESSSSKQIVATVLPQLLVCAGQIAMLLGAHRIKSQIRRFYDEGGWFAGWNEGTMLGALIGGTWVLAILVAILAAFVSVRNYERALGTSRA